eukprot:TRINITY_DN9785_c0_g1_i1.p1 TRINITY_DN9785_c0_g1~~TRINITY_DN9785_c0_g1_i1.p1  ORF type:complete len:275 (-),score=18.22 TRINITY_DN9785_c0_g1_i1:123-947(-)
MTNWSGSSDKRKERSPMESDSDSSTPSRTQPWYRQNIAQKPGLADSVSPSLMRSNSISSSSSSSSSSSVTVPRKNVTLPAANYSPPAYPSSSHVDSSPYALPEKVLDYEDSARRSTYRNTGTVPAFHEEPWHMIDKFPVNPNPAPPPPQLPPSSVTPNLRPSVRPFYNRHHTSNSYVGTQPMFFGGTVLPPTGHSVVPANFSAGTAFYSQAYAPSVMLDPSPVYVESVPVSYTAQSVAYAPPSVVSLPEPRREATQRGIVQRHHGVSPAAVVHY